MTEDNSNTDQLEFLHPILDRSFGREEEIAINSKMVQATDSASCCIPESYAHLFPVRASGTRLPLFGIYPGTPGSRDIVDFLPPDQPIYDFYFSEFDPAVDFPTVERLAELYLKDLRKVQEHGPYQLCGYSSGGLVAYEMARLLLGQGEKVSFLALFDTWHPQFTQNMPKRELVLYRLLRFVDRLRKYGRILLQGRLNDLVAGAAEFAWKRIRSVGMRVLRKFFRTAKRPSSKPMQVIGSLESYTPKPLAKRFIVIRPDDPVDKKLKDQTVGWRACAKEGVDVHFIRTEHGRMVLNPFAHTLANKIAPYLAHAPRQQDGSRA
jgi:thioesterase domain-containing protein